MNEEIPRYSASRLIERITICVEPELKHLYDELSGQERVKVAEIIRAFMRKKLPEIKSAVA